MRNGNSLCNPFLLNVSQGSYRTYEEWKHSFTDVVPVVPFVSSYRTYEEWKRRSVCCVRLSICVLTVPMRNGNTAEVDKLRESLQVLTVPMRNGNRFFVFGVALPCSRSYRTYEEWKLLPGSPNKWVTMLFLPYL